MARLLDLGGLVLGLRGPEGISDTHKDPYDLRVELRA